MIDSPEGPLAVPSQGYPQFQESFQTAVMREKCMNSNTNKCLNHLHSYFLLYCQLWPLGQSQKPTHHHSWLSSCYLWMFPTWLVSHWAPTKLKKKAVWELLTVNWHCLHSLPVTAYKSFWHCHSSYMVPRLALSIQLHQWSFLHSIGWPAVLWCLDYHKDRGLQQTLLNWSQASLWWWSGSLQKTVYQWLWHDIHLQHDSLNVVALYSWEID